MGALNSSIRKPGDDYIKPLLSVSPLIGQSYSFVPSIDQSYGRISTFQSGNVVLSRISLYPDPNKRFLREVHAPVRHSRLGSFPRTERFEGGANFVQKPTEKMGNCLGIQFPYDKVKKGAINCLEFFVKDKEKAAVIEIDDGDKENLGHVSDDIEEIENVDFLRGKRPKGYNGPVYSQDQKQKMDGKNLRFRHSNVVTDVNNVSAHYNLYDLAKRRDKKPNILDLEIDYYEKDLERLQLSRSQKKDEQVKKDVVDECFVPLTAEEEALVTRALSNSYRRRVMASHENSNIDITGEKLQCLRPGEWLNDEVINLYLELLKEREEREPQKFLKCHFFNTFFYKKLTSGRDGYNFQSVRRWTTQRKLGYNLLDCEKIFVPIHKEIHWCLAVINKKDKTFQYLDSFKGVDSQVMSVLARYYVDEVKDKTGKDIDVSSWKEEFVTDLPLQENGFDCGMFMIKYVDFYSRDIGLCFNQRHMPYFRRRTTNEILKLRAE